MVEESWPDPSLARAGKQECGRTGGWEDINSDRSTPPQTLYWNVQSLWDGRKSPAERGTVEEQSVRGMRRRRQIKEYSTEGIAKWMPAACFLPTSVTRLGSNSATGPRLPLHYIGKSTGCSNCLPRNPTLFFRFPFHTVAVRCLRSVEPQEVGAHRKA